MDKEKRNHLIRLFVAIALVYGMVAVLEATLRPTSIVFTVLRKGAIYSLVAVSMNLLNGFTGLFSDRLDSCFLERIPTPSSRCRLR